MQHLDPHLSGHWLHILILLLYLSVVTWSPQIRYLKSAIINLNILIIVYIPFTVTIDAVATPFILTILAEATPFTSFPYPAGVYVMSNCCGKEPLA